MNPKNASILMLLLLIPYLVIAQPLPCEDPPVMTSFCADACIICDIDGFTGRHEANIIGESPAQFAGECTLTAHNMQWIAFIAGSENLKVNMAVSNCQANLGLEFGLYKGQRLILLMGSGLFILEMWRLLDRGIWINNYNAYFHLLAILTRHYISIDNLENLSYLSEPIQETM